MLSHVDYLYFFRYLLLNRPADALEDFRFSASYHANHCSLHYFHARCYEMLNLPAQAQSSYALILKTPLPKHGSWVRVHANISCEITKLYMCIVLSAKVCIDLPYIWQLIYYTMYARC